MNERGDSPIHVYAMGGLHVHAIDGALHSPYFVTVEQIAQLPLTQLRAEKLP
jgi:hypothetical protein